LPAKASNSFSSAWNLKFNKQKYEQKNRAAGQSMQVLLKALNCCPAIAAELLVYRATKPHMQGKQEQGIQEKENNF